MTTAPMGELVVTSVDPLQPSPLATMQPEVNLATSPTMVSAALAPEVAQSASLVPGVTRAADSGASLSLAALSTNKVGPVALPEPLSMKSSTSVMDEMYRQFETLLPISSRYGYDFATSGVESAEELDDVWGLEEMLVDRD